MGLSSCLANFVDPNPIPDGVFLVRLQSFSDDYYMDIFPLQRQCAQPSLVPIK